MYDFIDSYRKHPSHGLFGGYFYDSPTSRNQYYAQAFLSGFSRTMAGYYNARDSVSYMDDYLNSRGMGYDDVKYASRTPGWSGGASAGATVTGVSKNVMDLYASSRPRKKNRR